ncbi:MAG: ATP-binding protein [Thermoanaerobaculia bacterium]
MTAIEGQSRTATEEAPTDAPPTWPPREEADETAGEAPSRPARAPAPITERDAAAQAPAPPLTQEDLGLDRAFLDGLVLKTLYTSGALSGDGLAEALDVPFWSFDTSLLSFQRRKLAEVIRSQGMGRRGYTFELTTEGRRRARELMESERYVGPAPVPLERYRYWIARQSVRHTQIHPKKVRDALEHLVLDPRTVELLGPAINASRSIFLYGEAGNGKTTISEAVVEIFGDHIYIPRAVYADGHVIQLFDLTVHNPAGVRGGAGSQADAIVHPAPELDDRFVEIERPMVMTGGELTFDQLELQYDRRSGAYQAPPHMRANGGVFVIDDFGRQRVPPRELLNRWMIPLDRGVDYLSFASGRRAAIPFDCVVIFATNLNPSDLIEEAFFRRIRYKIKIGSPERAHYEEIFRRVCETMEIPYRREAVDWIYREYYERHGIEPRACHPGDILTDLFDLAVYHGEDPALSQRMLRQACASYFMDAPTRRGNRNGNANGEKRNGI